MGLGRWLRKVLGGRQPRQEMVPFFDPDVGRVVRIPASELRPGTMQVRLQGTDEVVWVLAEQVEPGDIKHGEFDEGVRDFIRSIQAAFTEPHPLSFEEWEDGFRRDANPEQEIARWWHAANVYTAFTAEEPDAARRYDVYRCVITCLANDRSAVWYVLRPEALRRAEAERVVDRFFGKRA
ncbi:Uncharacterized protein OS=Pedosphaera parvula (strain Ellin514) GN=Cflav_PD1614 PE=4 SV=1 [Gemmata massiliana]|uniref:Uncharacterized protein n=1 Tax=Gemmata massiliana TaxID=1210884 RepID=A0A6P2D0B2_9BACT|nr:hypothetical protein [Gemmata massiliana]VTR94543.1 Uncharacterized protein OS=Pedosphaera parvula (strain Ellin514) GN=Cflav_PD1614 PE=4 SV=1 [Gemmata massiliana]